MAQWETREPPPDSFLYARSKVNLLAIHHTSFFPRSPYPDSFRRHETACDR